MAFGVDTTSAPESPADGSKWSVSSRIGFRFVCCYWILYCLPATGRGGILAAIPFSFFVTRYWIQLWHAIVPRVAIHFFHFSGTAVTYFVTGSGDTTLAYVEELCFLTISVVGALVWSMLDRNRRNYGELHRWLRLLIRYALSVTLLGYGFAKIFPLQFQPAAFSRLIEPFGDFSPMGVLWSFMGASQPYTMFAGAVEALGGALLLLPRTTTLGAMVAFGAMANVVALNFSYDVPVKLYSSNLLLMTVFLLAPEAKRLANVLLLNRPTRPSDLGLRRFDRKWMRVASACVWVLLIGSLAYFQVYTGWVAYGQTYVDPPRPPVYGLYDVEKFVRNGEDIPPLATDASRWEKFIAVYPGFVTIRMMNGLTVGFRADYDTARSVVTLNQNPANSLRWSRPDVDHLQMGGELFGSTLAMTLRKDDTSKFLLLNRGFHWINEQAFNR